MIMISGIWANIAHAFSSVWKRTVERVKKFASWLRETFKADDLLKAISMAWAGWYWYLIYGAAASLGYPVLTCLWVATILLLQQVGMILAWSLLAMAMVYACDAASEWILDTFQDPTGCMVNLNVQE